MLTADERERILAEERLKAEVREELKSAKDSGQQNSWWSKLIASDNFRWICTALAIPLSVFLWGQYSEQQAEAKRKDDAEKADVERKQRASVETSQRNVDLVIKLLPGLNQPSGSRERLNALAVLRSLEEQGELSSTLRASFERNVEELRDAVGPNGVVRSAEVRKELEVLSVAAPRSEDIAAVGYVSRPSVAVPGTKAFIQIFSEAQRPVAMQLQEAARSIGIAAPGVENVVSVAAKHNRQPPAGYDGPVLLVFKQEDQAAANRLAEAALKITGVKLSVLGRWDRPNFKNVPAGQLEIWLADPTRK